MTTREVQHPMFFDRSGAAIDLGAFRELHADREYRSVRRDTVDGRDVITVWLGTDQGFGLGDEPPLIFGTIVRDPVTGVFDDAGELLAATHDEAVANHDRRVRELSARDASGS